MWLIVLFIVLFLVATFFIWDAVAGLKRKWERRRIFGLAKERASETSKKLIVVGDPENGFASQMTGTDYEYGDVCIDLTGCPGAPPFTLKVKDRLENYVSKLPDNCCVLFISCVLEYIDVLDDQLVENLNRVSGGDLFIVKIESYAPSSRFYYGKFWTGEGNTGKRVVLTAPPDDEKLTWCDF